jgi:hypothetical protein
MSVERMKEGAITAGLLLVAVVVSMACGAVIAYELGLVGLYCRFWGYDVH